MLLDLYFHHTRVHRRVSSGVTQWQRQLWRRVENEPQAVEIVKVIESVAGEVLAQVAQEAKAANLVRSTLENMGIAYKQAYQEIYLELLAEMQQEQEDAQIAAVVAALL